MTTLSLTGAILYQNRHQAGLCLSPIRVWPPFQLSHQISKEIRTPNTICSPVTLYLKPTQLRLTECLEVVCLEFIFLELILELYRVQILREHSRTCTYEQLITGC